MRLAIIFGVVLGVSVIVGSLTTWGLTLYSSNNRVNYMAKKFNELGDFTIDESGMSASAPDSISTPTIAIQEEVRKWWRAFHDLVANVAVAQVNN